MMMDFTDKAGSINELLARPGNGQCADCQKRLDLENAWGVLRYGVLVCQDCKLVHISLESQRKQKGLVEDPGILSCAKSQVWTGDDFNRFIQHGNEKTNQNLLAAFPVWVYQPTPNDSISLKEQWISQKYRERSQEENQILNMPPKNAGTLCPVQFIRKSKSRAEPCAAVLHKEKLYLTSQRAERRKEVISIVDVETALLTQDNGIMLAYRAVDSPVTDEYLFAHLSHEDQTVVLEWVNTLLYIKYTLLKSQNPTVADKDLGKLLNRYVIRQSYITADRLLFFVLTESRLAVFEHHLDEKPRYQTRIYQNHMTSVQYLTRVGDVLNIQVEKVYGYDEWLQALDQALNNERLSALPERLQAPSPVNEALINTAMDNLRLCNQDAPRAPITRDTEPNQNQLPTEQPQQQQQQQQLVSPNAEVASNNIPLPNGKNKDAHCYPAIGPMGEMGKMYRGEVPFDAVKAPPTRLIPDPGPPQGPPVVMPPQSNGFSSYPSEPIRPIYEPQPSMPKKGNIDCYPPIGPLGLQDEQQQAPPPPPTMKRYDGGYQPEPRYGRQHSPPSHWEQQQSQAPPPPTMRREVYSTNGYGGGGGYANPAPSPPIASHPRLGPRGSSSGVFDYGSDQGGYRPTFNRTLSEPTWMKNENDTWNKDYYQPQYQSTQRQVSQPPPPPPPRNTEPEIWTMAEKDFDYLIEHGFVPASDMKTAQIDANKIEHARFCSQELYNAVKEGKYEMALSFLRGFRDIFNQSMDPQIRQMYVGHGEKETLKSIVLQHAQEVVPRPPEKKRDDYGDNLWQRRPSQTDFFQPPPTRSSNENPWANPEQRPNSNTSSVSRFGDNIWGEPSPSPIQSTHSSNQNPYSRISPEAPSTASGDSWGKSAVPPRLSPPTQSNSTYNDPFLIPPVSASTTQQQPPSNNTILSSLDIPSSSFPVSQGIWTTPSSDPMSRSLGSGLLGEDGWPSSSHGSSSQRDVGDDLLRGDMRSFRTVAPSTSIWSTN